MIMRTNLLTGTLLGIVASLWAFSATAAVEVLIDGTSIRTVKSGDSFQDGIYVANTVLPNEDVFAIPYLFSGDPENAGIEATFDDQALDILGDAQPTVDAVDFMYLDIAAHKAQSGVLQVTLSADGEEPAEMVLIDNIEPAAATGSVGDDGAGEAGGGSSGGCTLGRAAGPDPLLPLLILLAGLVIRRRHGQGGNRPDGALSP